MTHSILPTSNGTNGANCETAAKDELVIHNSMREKMLQGNVAATLTVKLIRTVEIATIAKSTGYDGLFIDMEHSSLSLETVGQICQAALLAGVTPIVRSPTKEPFFVSRILDGGAQGVVVPHIRSVQDACDVVSASKFYPIGHRSATSGLPQLGFKPISSKLASPALNKSTLVIPMIETLEALEDVEAIAAVPGVDSLLIGTSDLTAEMGIPGQYDDPRIEQAYVKVIAACRKAGVFLGAGGLTGRLDLMEKYCKMGVNWVLGAQDSALLFGAAGKRAETIMAFGENSGNESGENGLNSQK